MRHQPLEYENADWLTRLGWVIDEAFMSLSSNSRGEEGGSTPLVIPAMTRGGVIPGPGMTRGGVQALVISGYSMPKADTPNWRIRADAITIF